ncbi:hypothetical protein JW721_00830 [Candidatus Micrarchaeota archaeon]|nr:hypothetical protein [Candidatus Micrarchaeota archaeon]
MIGDINLGRVFIDLTVVLGIFLAIGMGILLKFRTYKHRPAIILLLLFALTGTADVVITTHYAYLKPQMEGNPLAAYFLSFDYGIALAAFLWAFGWILLCEVFMRLNVPPLAYFTLLVLFSGHLLGMLTWADNIKAADMKTLSWILGFAYSAYFIAGLRLYDEAGGTPGGAKLQAEEAPKKGKPSAKDAPAKAKPPKAPKSS